MMEEIKWRRKLLRYSWLLATTKRFVAAKERLRHSKAQESKDEASGLPQRRYASPQQRGSPRRTTLEFNKVKKPSSWRRTTSWTNKQRFLSSSLAHFPRPINICMLDLFRAPVFRENTLLRVETMSAGNNVVEKVTENFFSTTKVI